MFYFDITLLKVSIEMQDMMKFFNDNYSNAAFIGGQEPSWAHIGHRYSSIQRIANGQLSSGSKR